MKKRNKFITIGFVVAAYAILMLLQANGSVSNLVKGQLVPICCYIVVALALNLVVGFSGELSLGHGGFMAVGAFSTVLMSSLLANAVSVTVLRVILSILFGAIVSGLFGFIIGVPVLKLEGDYLAIVTLAFGEIIKSVINNLYIGLDSRGLHLSLLTKDFVLEEGGKMVINGPMGTIGVTKLANFTYGAILIVISLIVIYNLIDSKAGRAITASRDNRIAANSIGIHVTNYKMLAFVCSAILAGAAGGLFGLNYNTTIASKFDYNTSILILVYVVLGGLGNLTGTIISTSALVILPEILREFKDYRMLVYAILLILIMLITNNPTLRQKLILFKRRIKKKLKKARKEVVKNEQ